MPLSVGVVSVVVPSPWVPLSLVGSRMAAGAAGAMASMTMAIGRMSLAVMVPAGSVATTVSGLLPAGSSVVGVADQVPSGATVVVAITWPAGFLMLMVSPGVPVPVRVGVVSLVMPSPLVPLSLVGARLAVSTPASGATMVTGSGVGALTVPAGLVCTTLRLLVPRGSAVVGVAAQVPSGATVAVAMTLPAGSLTEMVLPGTPVPLSVGVVSVVVLSPWVPLSLVGSRMAAGAAGAGATGVALMLKEAMLLLSPPSLFRLPAASLNLSLVTKSMALWAPAVGVKVAV